MANATNAVATSCLFDQDHFLGLEATKFCIERLIIDSGDRVLDIGSGLGGPARYIAAKMGANVTGVEIQEDRYNLSKNLTEQVGLSKLVSFVNDDFVTVDLPNQTYTKIIAFLSILHITKKRDTLQKAAKLLEKGGMLYFEDYYQGKNYAPENKDKLLKTVSCPGLLPKREYLETLINSGIEITTIEDMTKKWTEQALLRYRDMQINSSDYQSKYGIEASKGALSFSKGVLELFEDEVMSGFRIIGKKR